MRMCTFHYWSNNFAWRTNWGLSTSFVEFKEMWCWISTADANPILEEQKCIVPFWNNIYVWFPLFKIMSSKIELRRQTMKLIKSNGFAHVASYNCICVDLFWLNNSVILIVFQLLSLCIDQTIVGVKDKCFSVELMQSNKQWNRWLNLLMR